MSAAIIYPEDDEDFMDDYDYFEDEDGWLSEVYDLEQSDYYDDFEKDEYYEDFWFEF